MEDWRRKKIEAVYAKWEKKGRGSPSNSERTSRSFVIPRPPRYSSGVNRFSRRKQQKQDALFDQTPTFVPSLGVNLSSLHAANNRKYISISRCCQKCLPSSRNKYYSETDSPAGLQNLLLVDVRKYSGFPWRFFPYVSYIYHTPNSTMSDHRKDTLQSSRVRDAIQSCSKTAVENESVEFSEAVRSQEKRARSIIYNMSSGVYSALVKIVGWLVFHIFGQLFDGLYVQKRHVHMLREAQKRGVPLVFLPGHKSHMDYIIMTFVLFSMGIRIPRIAAGDNLRLPIVSWIVTHLGGFFIKRKLDTAAGKDVLYRKCLHEYMERSLLAGDNMEFFIDGSRSRSGKHNSPKAGLLSVLVDSVKEGVVEDIMIVPVSISYDKLMERNFVRHELMGGSKRPETFVQALRGAWSLLTKNIGSVRVDFAQPFSVQEYLSSAVVSPHSVMELSNVSRSRSILNLAEHTQRKLVTALSHHITYEFQNCSSLMSPSIVAFLMLIKHRDGVKYSDLAEDYHWLEQMAVSRGRSMAFTGETSEAVHYALRYLGDLVVLEDGSSTSGVSLKNHILKPCLSLPDVFELLHHANQVSTIFVLEAVVACSLQCLLGDELLRGRVDNSSVLEVSREELIDEALFLCKLLGREFIFAPPCVDIWSALLETVDSFVNSEVLKMPEAVSGNSGGRRLPCSVMDSDESDQDVDVMLQVNTDARSREYLQFLQRILDPFLEAYWMTTISLLQLDTNTEETVFLKQLQGSLFDKMERGVLNKVESCSMDTLRNAVKSLVDMSVVCYRNTTQIRVSDADKLMEIAESIIDFKS